jgi:hypothetical protein
VFSARALVHPPQWLGRRDPDLAALRRAGRAAIVMPAMFAIGQEAIGDPNVATFAAFGSFAMLLLVDFGGPLRERLQDLIALALVGSAFVCVGTLASHSVWLSALSMAIVGVGVIFAGVVSSVLAAATTSLLLAFILPVTLAAPASSIPDRVAGWGMAAGAAVIAVGLLWPAPARGPLRAAATAGLPRAGGKAAHGGRLRDERQGRARGDGRRLRRAARGAPRAGRRAREHGGKRHGRPAGQGRAAAQLGER